MARLGFWLVDICLSIFVWLRLMNIVRFFVWARFVLGAMSARVVLGEIVILLFLLLLSWMEWVIMVCFGLIVISCEIGLCLCGVLIVFIYVCLCWLMVTLFVLVSVRCCRMWLVVRFSMVMWLLVCTIMVCVCVMLMSSGVFVIWCVASCLGVVVLRVFSVFWCVV